MKLDIIPILKESLKLSHEMGQDRNYDFILSTCSTISGLSESKTNEMLYDYLFQKFNESPMTNFDDFLEEILTYDEDGLQIKSSIDVSPEKPVEDEYITEEEDSDDDTNESENTEDEESNEDDNKIDGFLDQIGLKDLDEDKALVFLDRFKDIISEEVDEETANLIIYLLYQAYSEEEMSEGEISELEGIIEAFSDKELKEADDQAKKIGVITTIIASTLLFGIGGLLVSGLIFGLSKLSQDDYDKEKKDLDNWKDSKPEDLKKKAKEVEKLPEGDPEPPKNLIQAIKQDIKKTKEKLINKAKDTVTSANKKSVDLYQKGKDKISGKKEPDEKDSKELSPKEKKAQQAKDAESLGPDQYKKKWGKCPKGWRWDSKKNACVQNKKKEESISIDDLIV